VTLLGYQSGMLPKCVRLRRGAAAVSRNSRRSLGVDDRTAAFRAAAWSMPAIRENAMAKLEDGHIVESATEARAGERGPTVRNVLFISLASVAILFVAVYLYFFAA